MFKGHRDTTQIRYQAKRYFIQELLSFTIPSSRKFVTSIRCRDVKTKLTMYIEPSSTTNTGVLCVLVILFLGECSYNLWYVSLKTPQISYFYKLMRDLRGECRSIHVRHVENIQACAHVMLCVSGTPVVCISPGIVLYMCFAGYHLSKTYFLLLTLYTIP